MKILAYFRHRENNNSINTGTGCDEVKMKWRGIGLLALCMWMAVLLSGCSGTGDGQGERKEIEFTVMESEKLPQELREAIEKNKAQEIRMTYTDGGFMYLIRGYGEQETGGYSISVSECTEDEERIYFDTRLIGPQEQKKHRDAPSYPCLVVKIEAREKEAVIE